MNHISFRLADDLLKKLRKSAKANKRSISSEIVFRLLQTFNFEVSK